MVVEFQPRRVMDSCKIDLSRLILPAYISPKYDGIRNVTQNSICLSKSLKPFRSKALQTFYGREEFNDLDSEFIVGLPTDNNVIQRTYSAVMTIDATVIPDLYVFDEMGDGRYSERLERAQERVHKLQPYGTIHLVKQTLVSDLRSLLALEEEYVAAGYEGAMVRSPDGPYRHGDASMVGQELMKFKRFEDAEAIILDVLPLMKNLNPIVKNEKGLASRSSAKEGLVALEMMGCFLVEDIQSKEIFTLSGRITKAQRIQWWVIRESLKGRLITYMRFRQSGEKNNPRLPIFKCFRDPIDMRLINVPA